MSTPNKQKKAVLAQADTAHSNIGQNGEKHLDNWVVIQPGLFDFPVPDGEKPSLKANKCQICDTLFFPKREICPNCFFRGQLIDQTIGDRGRIYASTVINIPSMSGIEPPYACGYVDIDSKDGTNQVRIFAHFTDTDPRLISSGQVVELEIGVLRRDDRGRRVIAHVFRPVNEDLVHA